MIFEALWSLVLPVVLACPIERREREREKERESEREKNIVLLCFYVCNELIS